MRRAYHPWHKWECYKAGFYATQSPSGANADEAKVLYRDFLGDNELFESALTRVIAEWIYSCEHFLTNSGLNVIAWLGQASACIQLGLPSKYRAGFVLLTVPKQRAANKLALHYFHLWKRKYLNTLKSGSGAGIQMEFPM